MRIRSVIVLLSVPLSLGLLTTDATASSDTVKFSLDDAGSIRVPVTIDGRESFTFLLDTGSSRSVVSSRVVELLALQPVATTLVLTSTGSERRLVVKLQTTSIGAAVARELLASVVRARQMREAVPGIDGIIGQDFLSAFNYTLDYRNRRLHWTADAGGKGSEVRLALIPQEGRFLIRLSEPAYTTPVLLVPDSGAEAFVIYERQGRTPLRLVPAGGSMEVVGFRGRVGVRRMLLPELHLGSMTMRNQLAVVVERKLDDVVEGDGLLPLHLFASVSFNSQEGYLVLRSR